MPPLSQLYVEFLASTDKFAEDMANVSKQVREFDKVLKPIKDRAADIGRSLTASLSVPLAGIGAFAVKTGIDFESAFAGVRKTVDATEPQLQQLRDQFRQMAKEIPVSAVELAKVGEAAGQLGIKTEDIAKFTKTMADLGVSTNLTSDQAATAAAQIQNIFGAAGKDVDRFGATLVALGNAGASTEKDIIEMGLRIAGAGNQIGLTQAQVLSFASALSSVGINAEAGGSAISRVFLKMSSAVAGGGKDLANFAKVAGVSAEEFRKKFQTDAGGAVVDFINGIGRLKQQGANVSGILEEVVGKNIILKDTLLRASGAGSLLADQIELGNKAWEENIALTKEAEQRYKTTESQIQLVKNQLVDLGIELFDVLGPIIKETLIPAAKTLIDFIKPIVEAFRELPAPVQQAAVAIAAVAAAIGPLLLIGVKISSTLTGLLGLFTEFAPSIGGIVAAFGNLGAGIGLVGEALAGGGLVAGFEAVIALTGPIGLVVAAVGALGTAAYLLYQNSDSVKGTLIDVWNAIKAAAADVFNGIAAIVSDAKDAAVAVWNDFGPTILDVFSVLGSGIQALLNTVGSIVANAFRAIGSVISGALEAMRGLLNVWAGIVTLNWTRVWDGLNMIVAGAWKAISGVVTSGVKIIIDALSNMLSYWSSIFTRLSEHVPVVGNTLKSLGDALDSASKKTADFSASLNAGATAASAHKDAIKPATAALEQHITATQSAGKAAADTGVSVKGLGDAFNETGDKAKKASDTLSQSFLAALKPADDLNTDLDKLRGKFSDEQIVQVYGKRITEAADAQRAHGLAVTGSVAALEAMAQAAIDVQNEVDKAAQALKKLQAGAVPQIPLQQVGLPPDISVDVEASVPKPEALEKWTQAMKAASVRANELAAEIAGLKAEGLSDADVLKILGDELDKTAADSKKFGLELDAQTQHLIDLADSAKKSRDEAKRWDDVWSHAIGNVVTKVSQSITDLGRALLKGKNIGEAFSQFGKDIASAITQGLFTDLSTNLVKTITDPLQKAFDDFFKGLLKTTGIQDFMDELGKKLGGIITGAIKQSVEDAAVKTATGAATSNIPSGIPSSGGGGGGGGGSAPDITGTITGGITAAASVVTAIETRRLEGTMNAVEYNTRHMYINFDIFFQEIGWPLRDNTIWIREAVQTMVNQLDAIYSRIWDVGQYIAEAIPAAVPKMATGGYIEQSGLVYAHAGEVVVPAGMGTLRGSERSGDIHFHDPVFEVHVKNLEDLSNPEVFDRKIMRPIDRLLETGLRGYRAKWTGNLSQNKGIVSTRIRRQ